MLSRIFRLGWWLALLDRRIFRYLSRFLPKFVPILTPREGRGGRVKLYRCLGNNKSQGGPA